MFHLFNYYINSQIKSCKDLGIEAKAYFLESDITEKFLLDLIDKLNNNPTIDGIMINLPLPKHMNTTKILNKINLIKDVDGFKAENLGLLFQNNENLLNFIRLKASRTKLPSLI